MASTKASGDAPPGASYPCQSVARRTRRFTCSHVSPSPIRILHAVANDGDHVAILDDVSFVREASVPRDDVGAALLKARRHRDLEDVIQRGDQSPGRIRRSCGR